MKVKGHSGWVGAVRRACVALCMGLAASVALAGMDWETDFAKASAEAKAGNRFMLLDFTGSDWCGWCMKLDEEVFSRKAFREYAEENLVCVVLDFPRGKTLKQSLQEQNKALASKFGVRGYPSIAILSPDGNLVGKTGYQAGGADAYVAHLKQFIDPARKKLGLPAPTASATARRRSPGKVPMQSRTPRVLSRDENREMRSWTSASGATLTAALVEEKGSFVVLKKEGGGLVEIAQTSLSASDRMYIAELKKASSAPVGVPAAEHPR